MSEPAPDTPRPYVRYIDKTRAYYLSQGYDKPYQWAKNDSAPFTPLKKPLSESTVTLISTSEIAVKDDPRFDDNAETKAAGNVYGIGSEIPASRLYSRTQSYDRYATTLDDANAYFPIDHLHAAARSGRIGKVAAEGLGVYNAYSQRKTSERDAPEVLARCRAMGVDVAVLVPVWPVCHQTVSLVARHLEANGIPTVVIATARDIVESAAVPRLLFVDFPLGAPCGEPWNPAQQKEVLEMAFRLLETADRPQTTRESGLTWSKGQRWKDLIFTPEQPFLPGEAGEAWLKKKEAYRKMKAEGKI